MVSLKSVANDTPLHKLHVPKRISKSEHDFFYRLCTLNGSPLVDSGEKKLISIFIADTVHTNDGKMNSYAKCKSDERT